MKIKVALLCFLLSIRGIYAENVDLASMSVIDLYKQVEAINYDYEELKKLEKNYQNAKDREQSLANRTLTALTTAATGLGGMQLAQGLAEQSADKKAEADMAAYIKTMRCSYGSGNFVTAGPEPVELPGGNDATLMSLRSEYIALAKSLKERKESLGLKPGIESEEILDKANMGLYDDENLGITGGQYASLYRATALNSEDDQAQINSDKEKSANRVKYGGIAAGTGVAGGVVGNSLINGKLGEALQNKGSSTYTSGTYNNSDSNVLSNIVNGVRENAGGSLLNNLNPSALVGGVLGAGSESDGSIDLSNISHPVSVSDQE